MKTPSFLEGVALALAISLMGGVLYTALNSIMPTQAVINLLIPLLSLGYLIYLLRRSNQRIGRISVVLIWLVVAAFIWLFEPPFMLYLMMHIGLIWLIRSLYCYSSMLTSLADLGLNGLALAAGVWALLQTGSFILSLWSFFLVQALFVAIPRRINARSTQLDQTNPEPFQRAYRSAEAAVRKLISVN